MKKLYIILLAALFTGYNKLSAQCAPGNLTSGGTNASYAISTIQTFKATCSGPVRTVVATPVGASLDDFRGSGYYVQCRLRTATGTLLATSAKTDQWYSGATIVFNFSCANVALVNGATYQLEFYESSGTYAVYLFLRTTTSEYADGNLMEDGVARPAFDLRKWQVNIDPGTLSSAYATSTQIISPCLGFYDGSMNLIASVQASATNGISGSTTAKVWIETTQPASYVKRHYEITPAANASTATGKVTLYFTQAEFDAFNAVNTLKLPMNSSDVTGKAALRIEKRGGISSNGTGLPNTYTGSVTNIDPADADIIWNSGLSRWEVSFDVTGFSGFFVKTSLNVLPLQWLTMNAMLNSSGQTQLLWQVQETDIRTYTIERSVDNREFVVAGNITSKGDGANTYGFTEAMPLNGTAYYRIKQSGNDGKNSYSKTLRVSSKGSSSVSVYPNPFTTTITLQSNASQTARLLDASGRLVQTLALKAAANTINTTIWSKGIYTLQTQNGESMKMIKK